MTDERLRRQVEESSSRHEKLSAQQSAELESIRKRLEHLEQEQSNGPCTGWTTMYAITHANP